MKKNLNRTHNIIIQCIFNIFLLATSCIKTEPATNLAQLEVSLETLNKLLPEPKIDPDVYLKTIEDLIEDVERAQSPDELKNINLGKYLTQVLLAKQNYERSGGTQDLAPVIQTLLKKVNILYQAYPNYDFITPETSKDAAKLLLSFLLDKLLILPVNRFDEESAKKLIQLYLKYEDQNFDIKPYQTKIIQIGESATAQISKIALPKSIDEIEKINSTLGIYQFIINVVDTLNIVSPQTANDLGKTSNIFKRAIDILNQASVTIETLPKIDKITEAKKLYPIVQEFKTVLSIFEKFVTGIDIPALNATLEKLRIITQEEAEKLKDPWVDEITRKTEEFIKAVNKIESLEDDIIRNFNEVFTLLNELLTNESQPPAKGFKALIRSFKQKHDISSEEYKMLQKILSPLLSKIRTMLETNLKSLLLADPKNLSMLKIETFISALITNLRKATEPTITSTKFTFEEKNFDALNILILNQFKNKNINELSNQEKQKLLNEARKSYKKLSLRFHPDKKPDAQTIKTYLTDQGVDVQGLSADKIFDLLTTALNRIQDMIQAPDTTEINRKINELTNTINTIKANKDVWFMQFDDYSQRAYNINQNLLYPI